MLPTTVLARIVSEEGLGSEIRSLVLNVLSLSCSLGI